MKWTLDLDKIREILRLLGQILFAFGLFSGLFGYSDIPVAVGLMLIGLVIALVGCLERS